MSRKLTLLHLPSVQACFILALLAQKGTKNIPDTKLYFSSLNVAFDPARILCIFVFKYKQAITLAFKVVLTTTRLC